MSKDATASLKALMNQILSAEVLVALSIGDRQYCYFHKHTVSNLAFPFPLYKLLTGNQIIGLENLLNPEIWLCLKCSFINPTAKYVSLFYNHMINNNWLIITWNK